MKTFFLNMFPKYVFGGTVNENFFPKYVLVGL